MSAELDANFAIFEARWRTEWSATEATLGASPVFKTAFRRLVAMQAWRSDLFQDRLNSNSLQFALEGQNDLLIAYILARSGQWRSALQSQRAAIENYLNCLYFMDHPVEMELWEDQKYRTNFTDLVAYFAKHPKNNSREHRLFGLDVIKSEYATLSKAVHGSAKAFRMVSGEGPSFFGSDQASLMKWDHRNRQVIRGLNLLLISLFSEDLVATRKRNLRKSIALALRKGDKDWLKREFAVTIPF